MLVLARREEWPEGGQHHPPSGIGHFWSEDGPHFQLWGCWRCFLPFAEPPRHVFFLLQIPGL